MNRPFAAFDIDGTLIRWQLYHALGDELARRKLINPNEFNKVRDARLNWKKRTSNESFSQYESQLIKVFDEALIGLNVKDFLDAADAVFEEYKEQVYIYTRDLLKELKSQNYLLFAISGSPDLIVQKMANLYGFDDYAGTVFASDGTSFTGTKQLSINKKKQIIESLALKHNATWDKSIAIGDSEGDISMLETVEQPIVFNPSRQLFIRARDNKWTIVLERKNMIYKLEYKDGHYQLINPTENLNS